MNETPHFIKAEYIWLDGNPTTQNLRSKTRIIHSTNHSLNNDANDISLEIFPDWGFDGSSTGQAEGHNSDCLLKPVFFCLDPLREDSYLVLCEVYNADGSVHPTNKRALLRELMEETAHKHDAYIGFEQEYTLFAGTRPLGWPETGFPAPQGPFYCGVGAEKVYGREIVEVHMMACLDANLALFGTNAEVMPGQWEFQIGYRDVEGEKADPLTISDHTWLARFLLERIAEEFDISVSWDNKPMKGDWNGAGMHTNFSTKETRDSKNGMKFIEETILKLKEYHKNHILNYGHGLADRLTGDHETCSINEFKSGVSDRGASIRIPMTTAKKGYGYFEDRRPGANADPYTVSYLLLKTIGEV